MTLATFLARFPEFSPVDDESTGVIESRLAQAARRVSAAVVGDLYEDLVAYLAAHLIATSPQGQQARMVSKDGRSTYLDEYERLSRLVPTPTMYA